MGSPGADGNAATAPQLAFTKLTEDQLREIEEYFVMPFVEWRRSWEEVFLWFFGKEYPGDHMHWSRMLAVCMQRKDELKIPILLLRRYHAECAFDQNATWK